MDCVLLQAKSVLAPEGDLYHPNRSPPVTLGAITVGASESNMTNEHQVTQVVAHSLPLMDCTY